ncbi:MAG TPA: DNA mismatch repair endonuclease MutL [Pyrinomonadaceae bacterium]|nr:DNA mismatch repair endonuclease MutL [Pyrinomonadaceae bacterium]
MPQIRVLSDHVANQIAAGEVVERPASVAKELVENSIDAGARRVEVDVEAGGRRLLRVADDGCGMSRDDAVLAFERHATSKISSAEDLERVSTLGFRGEALPSIASVARVELLTQPEGDSEGTRVLIEGGRMRDVAPAARPRGTTVAVRDLFFNVPARRKFLRSEATESFHLANLVTHYALAHPEISFALTNNGREVLRASPAESLRERAYQIFGEEFLENLLEVEGGHAAVARVRGYVSAPRERRSTRDAQYLFVNGRFVRDRLVARALSEGYRSVLPQGTYPAALLFLEVPPEEVDVNVHPAKTEVRFRRSAAVSDAVREAVRAALSSAGHVRQEETFAGLEAEPPRAPGPYAPPAVSPSSTAVGGAARQEAIDFGRDATPAPEPLWLDVAERETASPSSPALGAVARNALATTAAAPDDRQPPPEVDESAAAGSEPAVAAAALPPLESAAALARETAVESLSPGITPLGQMGESFIVATDSEGLLLIDQHVAHERILFDKYRALEQERAAESQQLLVPETFDLTPAQAAAFGEVAAELERQGFGLMRLSGRTVAVRAVPADLPAGDARNLLAEILDAVEAERRGRAGATLCDLVAARLACRAAVKSGTPLTHEKMRWLIERLIATSSPATCPHGRPVILRIARRDIERGFRRP